MILHFPLSQVRRTMSVKKNNEGKKYGIIVGSRFGLKRKINSGSFGDLYEGIDIRTNEPVAIKLESTNTRHPQLSYEYKLYTILLSQSAKLKPHGIPKVCHNISFMS